MAPTAQPSLLRGSCSRAGIRPQTVRAMARGTARLIGGVPFTGLSGLHTLLKLGCRLGQGFLLSKPFQTEQLNHRLQAA